MKLKCKLGKRAVSFLFGLGFGVFGFEDKRIPDKGGREMGLRNRRIAQEKDWTGLVWLEAKQGREESGETYSAESEFGNPNKARSGYHINRQSQTDLFAVFFAVLLSAMADEEPVDQKRYYEDFCKPKCVKPLIAYQGCVKRIEGDDSGQKHCTGQYFDYWSCVDKCVAPKLFTKLK
ncbi:cytochrome b-c1 complex subunit 6 [Senna tora]|uniref:Complex III subunit VI n=1 Tax=Senna tora TaxID=362788 RepID=A0A834XCN8_9FABA|nr:cytochrome b-c1 complex subunit 6 [Senna tora]